jgi:hypothetical protein
VPEIFLASWSRIGRKPTLPEFKRGQNRCERAQQRSSVRVFDNFNDQKTANIQSRNVVNVLN